MSSIDHPTDAPNGVVVENIETVLRMEEQTLARQTSQTDRVSDAIAGFVGTIWFVLLQVALIGGWIAINLGALPGVQPFDSYPFSLLSMVVSGEGVLLSAFVLIRQNRMNALSDRRDHIDLQINLLTEREVTRLLQMTERIAERLGIEERAGAFGRTTAVDVLVEHLDEKLSEPSEP